MIQKSQKRVRNIETELREEKEKVVKLCQEIELEQSKSIINKQQKDMIELENRLKEIIDVIQF